MKVDGGRSPPYATVKDKTSGQTIEDGGRSPPYKIANRGVAENCSVDHFNRQASGG